MISHSRLSPLCHGITERKLLGVFFYLHPHVFHCRIKGELILAGQYIGDDVHPSGLTASREMFLRLFTPGFGEEYY